MEYLIQIHNTSKGQAVYARDLHVFLEVDSVFTTWCNRMFEYSFVEGIDFIPFLEESNGGRPKQDFVLTLECAKEISMLQRSKKGKIARQYFLECERKLKFILPQSFPEALRALADSKEREEQIAKELNIANTKINSDKPKVVFAESVSGSSNSILVREFAKDLCDDGFNIGEKRLFIWMRNNGYLNKNNEAYQHFINQGVFEVITRTVGNPNNTRTSKTTKITGKGQVYFANKIKNLVLISD